MAKPKNDIARLDNGKSVNVERMLAEMVKECGNFKFLFVWGIF